MSKKLIKWNQFKLVDILRYLDEKEKIKLKTLEEIKSVIDYFSFGNLSEQKFLQDNRLTCVSLYDDIYNDDISDESRVRFIYLDGKPVCILSISGDRLMGDEEKVAFIGSLSNVHMYHYLNTLSDEKEQVHIIYDLNQFVDFSNNFTTLFMSDDKREIYLQHPDPMRLVDYYPGMKDIYYINDNTELVPVEFVSFKPDENTFSEEDMFMNIQINGEIVQVPNNRVVIKK